MDWEFRAAENGNIALTGEIDLPDSGEFTVAIALGRTLSEHGREAAAIAGGAVRVKREGYVRQWQRTVVQSQV